MDTVESDSFTTSGFVHGGFQFLDSDILVTNDTSYNSIFGHTAMVVGDRIMEIMPATNNHPRLIKIYDAKSNIAWKSRYAKDTTVILRRVPAYNNGNTNCRDVSVKAAWYGLQYYINGAGKAVTYNKLAVVGDTKIAQCATLVYRTYMNGAGFRFLIPYTSQGITEWRNPSYFYPYDILDHRVKNGFSAIARF